MTTQGVILTLFGRTDVGKKREKDEDAFVISDLTNSSPIYAMKSPVSLEVKDRGILIAVSDGMGGAQAGEVASKLVLSAVRHGMSTVQASSPGAALQVSVKAANQDVFNSARATGRAGMGATLTAVLFHGVYAYIAQIGDSRAYLLRAGRMVQLTRDQSYVQTLIDSGALTQEESETSELKNVILQAMGISADIDVALNRIAVRRRDRFLVCSDGLSGKLAGSDMMNGILDSATLESACARLVETAVARGAEDDITVILAEVSGEGVPVFARPPERVAPESPQVLALA